VTLYGDGCWAEIAVADDGIGEARAEDGGGLRCAGWVIESRLWAGG